MGANLAFIRDLFCESKVPSRGKPQLAHELDVRPHRKGSPSPCITLDRAVQRPPGSFTAGPGLWNRRQDGSEDSDGRCKAIFGESTGYRIAQDRRPGRGSASASGTSAGGWP